jgi:polyvinyl alcohol dehydrogenase (cytochrome)
MIYDATVARQKVPVVGSGMKNGSFVAINRNTGDTLWVRNLGPGASLGGIERACASDGVGVYCPSMNYVGATVPLMDGTTTDGGFWTRMDAATGAVVWQTKNPTGAKTLSPMTLLPTGIVFGCSLDPKGICYAMDAVNGHVLKEIATGASNGGGVSVVNGRIYVGNGYDGLNGLVPLGGNGTSMQVYAVPGAPADTVPVPPVPPRRRED